MKQAMDQTGETRRSQVANPPSFAQEQLWFIHEYNNAHPVLNLPILVRLRGRLDVGALGRAFGGVVARHEALRTRLIVSADGGLGQVIDPPGPVELGLADYAGLG